MHHDIFRKIPAREHGGPPFGENVATVRTDGNWVRWNQMQELCHMGWLCFAMPAHAAQIPNNRGAATTARVKCTTAQQVPFRAKPEYRQFGHTSRTRCATHGSRMPDHRLPDAPGKIRNDLQPSLPIRPVMPQIVTIPLPLMNAYAPYRAPSSHRALHRNGSPNPILPALHTVAAAISC